MKKGRFIIFVLLLMMFHGTVFAENKTFVIGVENIIYLPYYSHNESGEYIGASREILDAFAEHKGYTFEYRVLPLENLFSLLMKKKEIDFKFPDNNNWQAEFKEGCGRPVYYSEPVFSYTDGIVVLPENKDLKIESLKIMGTVTEFTPWEYLDMINDNRIICYKYVSFQALIKEAVKGTVQGVYMNPVVTRYHLENTMKLSEKLVFNPNLPHTKGSYLLSTTRYPTVIDEFNDFLLHNPDVLQAVIETYKLTQ